MRMRIKEEKKKRGGSSKSHSYLDISLTAFAASTPTPYTLLLDTSSLLSDNPLMNNGYRSDARGDIAGPHPSTICTCIGK